MASYKELRNMLLIACDSGDLSDQDFLVLYNTYQSKNPEFPFAVHGRFSFDAIDEAECLANLRVRKQDIPLLVDVLGIPEKITCPQRSTCSGIEAFCILLKRLAYSCRYSDMIPHFGRSVPELCMITNTMLDWIFENHGHRILDWNANVLNAQALEVYADAIQRKRAPLPNIFGFIDGTLRPISRPGKNQRVVYNRHKRIHSLKFQSLALPNGLIGQMYGPVEGKRHDAGMLADSNLLQNLEAHTFSTTGEVMAIYGDPGYFLRVQLQAPYRNANITPAMQNFNRAMSSVRVSVEWLFGDITNYFRFIDFKKNLKIGMSCVGKTYLVCALFHNALTCLYGNMTSEFFDLDPPTLQEYFQ